MKRYVPPHMRQRGAPAASSSRETGPPDRQPSSSSTSNSLAPRPSRRDWSSLPASSSAPGPCRNHSPAVLASRASDLRPMRNGGMKVELDEMEMLQSVSRSGGDGAEGDALKDWDMQKRFRHYVDARLEKHHSTFQTPKNTPPSPGATDELESLGSIVLLMRKLREGVVASHRIDAFAIEVFEASARLSILARNTAQALSSLSGLVPGLYQAHDDLKANGKGKDRRGAEEDVESLADDVASLVLFDHRDNRAEFASLLLLFHLAHTESTSAFHGLLQDLTAPWVTQPRAPVVDISNSATSCLPRSSTATPFISRKSLCYAIKASRSIAPETFDPLVFFALLRDESVSPYERAILSWAAEKVRERAWEVMRRAYLEVAVGWAGKTLNLEEQKMERWVVERGGRVEGARVKLR